MVNNYRRQREEVKELLGTAPAVVLTETVLLPQHPGGIRVQWPWSTFPLYCHRVPRAGLAKAPHLPREQGSLDN